MNAKFDPNLVAPLNRLIAVSCIGLVLGACSRDLSAQSTHATLPIASALAPSAVAAAEASPAPATIAPEPMVRALPDFSQLVDRYGPAVVNVEVTEKPRPGGLQGLSPNDPFYDFFRRFGIPAPEQGQRG